MLPRNNRLTKKKDFEAVFKKGESAKNGFLLCKAIKNCMSESRFGFVVSKKISAKAAIRNNVKRRLQEAVFSFLLTIQAPMDVVIIALPGIEKKEFMDFKEMVEQVFKKLKLL